MRTLGFLIGQAFGQICGGQIDGDQGELISPGYPRRYPDNLSCVWRTDELGVYSIDLSDMEIESDLECRWDYLEIKFGDGFRRELFCGGQVPELKMTGPGPLEVKFVTDGSTSFRGFKLNYERLTDVGYDCGNQTLPLWSGVFTSPQFPSDYPSYVNCEYVLDAEEADEVSILINQMDMQKSSYRTASSRVSTYADSECMVDYLELEFGTSGKRERFCGTQSVQLAPNFGSGPAKLRIVTDGSDERKGFSLRYQVIPSDACRSSPCLHGGQCNTIASGFTCTCPEGTEGQYCEIVTDPCKLDPCKNGATCINVDHEYTCQCLDGFEGKNCEFAITTTTTTRSTTTTTAQTTKQPLTKSIESLFKGECELSDEGRQMIEDWLEQYREWQLTFADYQRTYETWKNNECKNEL